MNLKKKNSILNIEFFIVLFVYIYNMTFKLNSCTLIVLKYSK